MKTLYKKIFPYILSFEILFVSFFSCSVSVYAADFMPTDIVAAVEYGIQNNDWEPFYRFLYNSADGLMYLFSQMGALTTKDFVKWVDNNQKLESLAGTVPAKKEDNNIVFTKEFMAQLKAILDEYIKTEFTKEENGGFIPVPTMDMSTIPPQWFLDSGNYKTFRNLMAENGLLMVTPKNDWGNIGAYFLFGDPFYNHSEKKKTDIVLVADKGSLERYRADPSLTLTANFYDANRWRSDTVSRYTFRDSDVHQSWNEGPEYASTNTYSYSMSACLLNATTDNVKERNTFLCSLTGERVRVFVSEIAAQNYSAGNRKVYFTENYYNYVPEDLSVSIDDLQKTVDDLQKVIDELLKQIGNNTSEKEIMDLLKQILEELRNQQGGGNEGGGDVNIDIDLSTTNSWLSKIYAKVSQIFDKMSDGSDGTGGSILQKGLDSILVKLDELSGMLKKYLSEITGDLDDIKGQLENMTEQEFDEKSDSFLKDMVDMFSEIADVAKGKFPFSIPNDMRILLERIAITPSEPVALYSEDMSGVSVYSDDHRGGSASRDDETDSPGGGGASRPGTGFIDVEHGGDGGSKEPVESKNGAPVFRLPIVIERYHIEEYIVIDMSPFEPVSRMSRSLFMIMYVICLYNLTFKVMGLWGDLVG